MIVQKHFASLNLSICFLTAHNENILCTSPFSDLTYIRREREYNWCVNAVLGGYPTLCVNEILEDAPLPSPVPGNPATATAQTPQGASIQPQENSDSGDDSGVPGWAIGLIIIFLLLILGCVGFWVYARMREERDKERSNDFYTDDNGQAWHPDDDSQDRSYQPDREETRIVVAEPQRQMAAWAKTSDNIESVSYGSKRIGRDPSVYHASATGGRDPTMYIPNQKAKRDPTMYIPGQEGRPDPDTASVFMMKKDRRSRRKDPSMQGSEQDLKPQLDP